MIKILISLLLFFSVNAYATQVTVPISWNNGDTVTAAKLNSINNAFANVINGNLDNTNMASGYKLFQVVASLPAPGNQGNVAFLTSNNTLNLDSGSAWLSTVTPSGTAATGDIPYYNSGWQLLSPGTQNLPLVSNGISSLPSYQILGTQGGGIGQDFSAVVQGNVPYFSSTGTISTLAPGTSGQYLQTQGASANPQWSMVGWVPNNIQVFTASGTWTKPSGVNAVYVKVIGAGGNGAGVNSGGAGGGGGGGYAEGIIAVTGNVTVTIGSTNSFAGSTTISSTAGSNGSTGTGGAGGSGSGGTINLTGSSGQTSAAGGAGGSSIMGAGGYSVPAGTIGIAGSSYGGGGGGGTNGSGSAGTGDVGAVIIYY